MYSKETVLYTTQNGEEVKQEMVFGTGRLTANPPELKHLGDSNGGSRCVLGSSKGENFSIAFNIPGKPTIFHPIEAWGKTAERMKDFCFKGQEVEVAGKLVVSTYTAKTGEERTVETLVVYRFDAKQFKEKDANNTIAQ